MKQAIVDEIALEYEEAGQGEPVVFIHGGFIADAFRPLLGEPRLRDYRLVNYRRRGYGGSTAAASVLSIDEQAADCAGLLQHLGIERAHVVGHSFGGAVGLHLALERPELVQSLSLLEPALMLGASAEGYRASLKEAIAAFGQVDTEVVVDRFMEARTPGYRPLLDGRLPGAFDQAVRDAGTTLQAELPGLLEWSFGEQEARRVTQPVLSVLGGRSHKLSPRFEEVHRLLLEWLPDAAACVLPGTTHFLQVEDPGGMAEALASFFARHPIDRS